MYERFYSFRKAPFANIPDPEFLLETPQHQQALSVLRYALLSRAGFCVITGNIGAGKTTLVRHALQTLEQPAHIGLVSNTQCESFEELLCWILLAFDLEFRGKTKVEMYEDFVQLLIRKFEAGTPVTLVVDEAQNLGIELLEQLRMLSNINTERGQILQTILIGQPELWTLLHDPRLTQFAQRISYQFFLSPLSSPQAVGDYIEHRIRIAGGNPGLFLEEAFPAIYRASRGVPRLINTICDKALVYGFGESAPTIGIGIVERVLLDNPIWSSEASSPASRPPPDEICPDILEPEAVIEAPAPAPPPAQCPSVDRMDTMTESPDSGLPKPQALTNLHEGSDSEVLGSESVEVPGSLDAQSAISGSMPQQCQDPEINEPVHSLASSTTSLGGHEDNLDVRKRIAISETCMEAELITDAVCPEAPPLESDRYRARSTRTLTFRSRISRLRASYG